MKEWKTYRTRFLVNAKQLTSTLSFVDHLGRQHTGRKGDYLVESSDGVLSIAPRRIFEDIYVPMRSSNSPRSDRRATTDEAAAAIAHQNPQTDLGGFKPLDIQAIPLTQSRSHERSLEAPAFDHSPHRKLPQSVRRNCPPRLGLM